MSTAMPWAEPPPQPSPADQREAAEAAEAAELDRVLAARRSPSAPRCAACGYRKDAAGHARKCPEGAR